MNGEIILYNSVYVTNNMIMMIIVCDILKQCMISFTVKYNMIMI